MPDTISSANMNLPVPTVAVAPGPEWAEALNACLALIDQHTHASGSGVPINPDGININSDLSFANNDAIQFRSVRFFPQSANLSDPTDLGCLYESGIDLYYNDGSGNQIRITQSGGVAGSPGSIAGLASPASATYVGADDTFVWESDTNTAANMDFGFAIFRNATASSFGLTLSAPLAMGADFAITLPSLPASQKFLTLDNSGNMAATWAVDNSSLEVSSNSVRVKALGIATSMIAANAVTRPKLEAVGQQVSSSSASFTTSSTSLTDVTLLTVSITTSGRPVMLFIEATNGGIPKSRIGIAWGGASGSNAQVAFLRDASIVSQWQVTQSTSVTLQEASGSYLFLDTPAAGTYTYKVQTLVNSGSDTISFLAVKLVAYEL